MQIPISNYGTTNESIRENWIAFNLLQIPVGLTILDAGAGDQHHKKDCQHLKYVSQDFAQYDGNGNNSGLQMNSYNYGNLDIIGDITNIPRDNESFDAVLCSEVLEHLPHPDLAIKELSRLLKPGGTLLLTAPFCSLTHFAPYHFVTGFNQYWYQAILPENNLEPESIEVYGNYFEYLTQEMHRLPSIINRYCNTSIDEDEANIISDTVDIFQKYGEIDNNSHELLCYGMMIIAKKKLIKENN
jgi:ubiquinone/menaquinone biosynthesis C-methylase UbiE